MNEKNKHILLWVLAVVPLIVTILYYDKLPEKIPMHWNTLGEVDRMDNKFPGAFIMPVLVLAIPLMMAFLPKIDPRRANYTAFKGAYYWFQLCFVVLFGSMSIFVLMVSLGYNIIRVDTFVKLVVGIMITVFGNLMPKLKNNYFAGIRTPWTLANEEVWFSTHRLAGKMWFAAGIVMIALSFIPGQVTAILYFSTIILAAFIPVVYSYFRFRKVSR